MEWWNNVDCEKDTNHNDDQQPILSIRQHDSSLPRVFQVLSEHSSKEKKEERGVNKLERDL